MHAPHLAAMIAARPHGAAADATADRLLRRAAQPIRPGRARLFDVARWRVTCWRALLSGRGNERKAWGWAGGYTEPEHTTAWGYMQAGDGANMSSSERVEQASRWCVPSALPEGGVDRLMVRLADVEAGGWEGKKGGSSSRTWEFMHHEVGATEWYRRVAGWDGLVREVGRARGAGCRGDTASGGGTVQENAPVRYGRCAVGRRIAHGWGSTSG